MNSVNTEPVRGTVRNPTARLSLALVSPGWPPDAYANGIITVVSGLAQQMRRIGHAVTVIADRGTEDPGGEVQVVQPLRRSGQFAVRMLDKIARDLSPATGERRQVVRSYTSAIRGLIAEGGLQLVDMEESFGYSRWLQGELAIPVAVRLHGPWFLNAHGVARDDSYRARVRAEGLAIRDAFALSSPSADVLDRTRAMYGLELPRARIIPNSVEIVPDDLRWSADAADRDEILFIGRFDRHKGGDVMIDAFAELARRRPNLRLRFVGPDRGLVDDAGRRWSIGDYMADRLNDVVEPSRCAWMGQQLNNELPKLRRGAGIVVIPSRYETFGVTVLEAMMSGCPLVASRAGGIPEIVDDGINGLLVEPGRHDELAARLETLLDDRDLAARLGHQAAVDSRRRFSPEVVALAFEAYYREAIDAFGRRRGGTRPR